MTRKTVSKTVYVANDRTEFDNEQECILYEKNPEMYGHMEAIRKYCKTHDCIACAFCYGRGADDEPMCWFEDVYSPDEW